MTAWVRQFLPILHFDRAETIPLVAIGYTVFRASAPSLSFPKRMVEVDSACVIEYAYYWDYDIQHMYDLEHIWVSVGRNGELLGAQGSFHGKYLTLLDDELSRMPPTGGRVHAFCQPGKHAFLPDGRFFRLLPDWRTCCMEQAGGGVLVGGPFAGMYASTPQEDARSARYLREQFAFEPTLDFSGTMPEDTPLMPWEKLAKAIPQRIEAECARLEALYGEV